MSKLVYFNNFHLNERGTDVATYNYAKYNQDILGNRSIILTPVDADNCAIDKFKDRFEVVTFGLEEQIPEIVSDGDVYYSQVSGRFEYGKEPPTNLVSTRTAVHTVFRANQKRGDRFATISDWVAHKYGTAGVKVVPYMVEPPCGSGDLREMLGIPEEAIVFGRHGGLETFDIPFAHEVVKHIVSKRSDIYFLFMNTLQFAMDHPQIIHLPRVTDLEFKSQFIRSCDAMLHARTDGETFGLAVAEFSVHNKPIITWTNGVDNYHLSVLGDDCYKYTGPNDLVPILENFSPVDKVWDKYTEKFNPAVVMDQFKKVFLDE